MNRLVLVDGNALLHRAYHALPPMTTKKGELVNGVFGFTSMLLKAVNELQPDFLAIAWDEKGPTFRHQAYSQYKATRGPTDEALDKQYKRVYQMTKALNTPEFRVKGFEADDLIGTLAIQATKKEKTLEVIILTGDRDIMQVIDERVKILMPRKTIQDVGLYGKEEFVARFGFEPRYLVDYKALSGDQSDNIPGVAGIGEKTATELIQKFGLIEKIYKRENLKTLPERLQKLLAEGAEDAVMSKNLATLDLDAPIKLDLKKCRVHEFDHNKVLELFQELEFKSLMGRIPGSENLRKTQINRNSDRTVTSDLDLQVTPILQKMSQTGVLIDLKFLNRFGNDLKGKLSKIEKQIYSYIGHQINLNSPKQLQVVLFDELSLPVVKKTKTGRSTNEGTLHELMDSHPVVPLLLQYRELFKLISTYVDALPKSVAKDDRIHSTFNVEGAATGRLSSQNPNLQNIPVRGEMGGEIRKAFVAPKNKILLTADYSQIELRIMAHLSGDKNLKKAFEQGLDIHTATASKIFKLPLDKVDKKQRAVGKTMNFATLYGQGPHALSRQLGVEYEVARQYIAEYFEQFPQIKQWMQKTLAMAYEKGYVQTLWGRKRYFPELKSSNKMFQAQGERAAINMPVQGSAADMIKKAMVEIEEELGTRRSCVMILQVHDELLFECSPDMVKEVGKMVKNKMENALKLSVPVVVDLKVGPNWAEMKPLEL